MYIITVREGETIPLGDSDLNLCSYTENGDFKYMKLPLRHCQDDEAYIEIGIKGVENDDNTS